jgi:integrase
VVWIARYRNRDGAARYAKPSWNGGKSSFELKGDAQRAIDEALDRPHGLGAGEPETLGGYFMVWTRLHPRSKRTNKTNADRISYVLDLEIEGRPLRDWQFDELRRRHALALVDHMLREQGRAVQGVRGILSVLSAMAEDAITDEVAEDNAFKGLRLRRSDPRARKASRQVRIWSFEQMRTFAAGGRPEVRAKTERPGSRWGQCFQPHDYEALILTPGLTGLRLGEVLALRREDFDGQVLRVRATAHEGELIGSSEEKNHDREVPVPPSLATMIRLRPPRIDTDLLFPTPTGMLWRERNFYRDVWDPARIATGLDPTPHEFRHSYVSHLRAAGIDDADLARATGHSVETMLSRYTHALGKSHDAIRKAIG